ncbi:MAG: HPP family protein [Candidatus Nanopelagicales bacterium]
MNIAMRESNLSDQILGFGKRFNLSFLEQHHNSRLVLTAYVFVNSAITIAILSVIALVTDLPFVFPSLGPTAFILFFSSMSAAACPRNVISGHLIGVLVGFGALAVFGLLSVDPDLDDTSWQRLGAVALCLSVTLAVMVLFNVPHAPAGATTLIVGLGLMRTPGQLTILMLAVVLMVVQAMVINRLAGLAYPWWGPASEPSMTTAK